MPFSFSRGDQSGPRVTTKKSSQRVFLVEDNALIRKAITDALEDLSDSKVVAWASTERQAVADMRAIAWNIALVDLFLEEGSGLGVAHAFMERPPEQLLYVVTNYATPAIRERCKRLNVTAVFDKSTELDDLLDVLLPT